MAKVLSSQVDWIDHVQINGLAALYENMADGELKELAFRTIGFDMLRYDRSELPLAIALYQVAGFTLKYE